MWINYKKERLGAFLVEAEENTEASGEILDSGAEQQGIVWDGVSSAAAVFKLFTGQETWFL